MELGGFPKVVEVVLLCFWGGSEGYIGILRLFCKQWIRSSGYMTGSWRLFRESNGNIKPYPEGYISSKGYLSGYLRLYESFMKW